MFFSLHLCRYDRKFILWSLMAWCGIYPYSSIRQSSWMRLILFALELSLPGILRWLAWYQSAFACICSCLKVFHTYLLLYHPTSSAKNPLLASSLLKLIIIFYLQIYVLQISRLSLENAFLMVQRIGIFGAKPLDFVSIT